MNKSFFETGCFHICLLHLSTVLIIVIIANIIIIVVISKKHLSGTMLLLLLLLSCFSHVQLCDPIDGSPPGSAVPGILQARTLEWVAISFSSAWKWKVKVKSFSCVRLFSTLCTAAYQAPLSMGFSRQEYWSEVPLPSPKYYARCGKKENLTTYNLSGICREQGCYFSVIKSCPALGDPMDCSTPGTCLPLSQGVCSNSYSLSWWCNLTISSSAASFSFHIQYFPASGYFPMSWLFASGGPSIGASLLVLPMNIQGWFSLGLTGLLFLLSKGLKSLLQNHSSKLLVLQHSAFFRSNSHIHTWLLKKA